MIKKINLKQGTRAWEYVKETRIGSSEVFDIVRYYARDNELQNCGINAEKFREEKPFVSTWALYHKMLNDGLYQKPLLEPWFSEYGLAMETFGLNHLQQGRELKLKKGIVYITDNLIASLDISGISEEIDVAPYDYGTGKIAAGKKFVCEQKTISPFKDSLPLKYVIQAQYQIMISKSDFFMLQAMILTDDTPYERGKIVSIHNNSSKKKFIEYVTPKVKVQYLKFKNNEALAQLVRTCLDRFFNDVKARKEPKPFLDTDKMSNIITSIRCNSFYNPNMTKEYDLSQYSIAKSRYDQTKKDLDNEKENLVHFAMNNNCSRFVSTDGTTASFSSDGKLLVKQPKESDKWLN